MGAFAAALFNVSMPDKEAAKFLVFDAIYIVTSPEGGYGPRFIATVRTVHVGSQGRVLFSSPCPNHFSLLAWRKQLFGR